jgi:hypothetical protein
MGILPNEAAIVRLVGALLLEQNSLETLAAFGHTDQLRLPAVAALNRLPPETRILLLHHPKGYDPLVGCALARRSLQ